MLCGADVVTVGSDCTAGHTPGHTRCPVTVTVTMATAAVKLSPAGTEGAGKSLPSLLLLSLHLSETNGGGQMALHFWSRIGEWLPHLPTSLGVRPASCTLRTKVAPAEQLLPWRPTACSRGR